MVKIKALQASVIKVIDFVVILLSGDCIILEIN